MATHPEPTPETAFKRLDRILHPAPPAQPALVDPLLPHPLILEAIVQGERLTTGQVIARMGLLSTPALQGRIVAALRDYGFRAVPMRERDRGPVAWIWVDAPSEQVSPQMRRIHQDGDRARGMAPLVAPRPSLLARVAAFVRRRA